MAYNQGKINKNIKSHLGNTYIHNSNSYAGQQNYSNINQNQKIPTEILEGTEEIYPVPPNFDGRFPKGKVVEIIEVYERQPRASRSIKSNVRPQTQEISFDNENALLERNRSHTYAAFPNLMFGLNQGFNPFYYNPGILVKRKLVIPKLRKCPHLTGHSNKTSESNSNLKQQRRHHHHCLNKTCEHRGRRIGEELGQMSNINNFSMFNPFMFNQFMPTFLPKMFNMMNPVNPLMYNNYQGIPNINSSIPMYMQEEENEENLEDIENVGNTTKEGNEKNNKREVNKCNNEDINKYKCNQGRTQDKYQSTQSREKNTYNFIQNKNQHQNIQDNKNQENSTLKNQNNQRAQYKINNHELQPNTLKNMNVIENPENQNNTEIVENNNVLNKKNKANVLVTKAEPRKIQPQRPATFPKKIINNTENVAAESNIVPENQIKTDNITQNKKERTKRKEYNRQNDIVLPESKEIDIEITNPEREQPQKNYRKNTVPEPSRDRIRADVNKDKNYVTKSSKNNVYVSTNTQPKTENDYKTNTYPETKNYQRTLPEPIKKYNNIIESKDQPPPKATSSVINQTSNQPTNSKYQRTNVSNTTNQRSEVVPQYTRKIHQNPPSSTIISNQQTVTNNPRIKKSSFTKVEIVQPNTTNYQRVKRNPSSDIQTAPQEAAKSYQRTQKTYPEIKSNPTKIITSTYQRTRQNNITDVSENKPQRNAFVSKIEPNSNNKTTVYQSNNTEPSQRQKSSTVTSVYQRSKIEPSSNEQVKQTTIVNNRNYKNQVQPEKVDNLNQRQNRTYSYTTKTEPNVSAYQKPQRNPPITQTVSSSKRQITQVTTNKTQENTVQPQQQNQFIPSRPKRQVQQTAQISTGPDANPPQNKRNFIYNSNSNSNNPQYEVNQSKSKQNQYQYQRSKTEVVRKPTEIKSTVVSKRAIFDANDQNIQKIEMLEDSLNKEDNKRPKYFVSKYKNSTKKFEREKEVGKEGTEDISRKYDGYRGNNLNEIQQVNNGSDVINVNQGDAAIVNNTVQPSNPLNMAITYQNFDEPKAVTRTINSSNKKEIEQQEDFELQGLPPEEEEEEEEGEENEQVEMPDTQEHQEIEQEQQYIEAQEGIDGGLENDNEVNEGNKGNDDCDDINGNINIGEDGENINAEAEYENFDDDNQRQDVDANQQEGIGNDKKENEGDANNNEEGNVENEENINDNENDPNNENIEIHEDDLENIKDKLEQAQNLLNEEGGQEQEEEENENENENSAQINPEENQGIQGGLLDAMGIDNLINDVIQAANQENQEGDEEERCEEIQEEEGEGEEGEIEGDEGGEGGEIGQYEEIQEDNGEEQGAVGSGYDGQRYVNMDGNLVNKGYGVNYMAKAEGI